MSEESRICEETREALAASVSADAIGPELAAARAHLETCAGCRAYLAALRGDDRALADFATLHADRINELTNRTLAAIPARPARRRSFFASWRNRTAAVAAVAAALFLVVFFQGPDVTFDAWAEVVETVRQASSASFRLRDMDNPDIDARQTYSTAGTAHRTYEDGGLMEALFVDFTDRELLFVAYPLKLAVRMTMDEAMAESFREHDPAATFDFLREYEYEELGNRRLDGRQVVGIRVTDARFLAQRMENAELELWVDPETKLPVRFDVTGDVSGERRHVRFQDFVWNADLPADEFDPELPSGFEITDGGHLQVDQEHGLEGLRLFADVVGRYPATLAYESLKKELWRSAGARSEPVGPMVVKMFRIRLASDFYGQLVKQERHVAYHGATVRPGDGDRVLMRWRLDDGRYEIVFGDLESAVVDADEALELEARR